MCKIKRGWSGNFSSLPRFKFGVYADWNDARKPRLILHVTVIGQQITTLIVQNRSLNDDRFRGNKSPRVGAG